jgi:hypothetical protein
MTSVFEHEFTYLVHLDVSNIKITDKQAIPLLDVIFAKTNIEILNLARNGLGFKTGTFLLAKVPKANAAIKKINLNYNLMSAALKKSISSLLTQISLQRMSIKEFESADIQDDESEDTFNKKQLVDHQLIDTHITKLNLHSILR